MAGGSLLWYSPSMSSHPKYILAYIFPSHGVIHEAFARSLLGLGKHYPPEKVVVKPSARPYAARNEIIDEWLTQYDEDFLVFVDTDESFTPQAIEGLFLAHETVKDFADQGALFPAVVGGLVFRWNEPETRPEPTMYFWNPDRLEWSMSLLYPNNQVCRVDATGAGNILIHRRGAESARERHGRYLFEDVRKFNSLGDEYTQGNDITFCERVGEDPELGIYVNTGAKFGHGKPMWITEKEAVLWRDTNLQL